ncbi:MAG: RRXRR domain-containing protein, partial [Myxococcota bacterium]
MENRVFVLNTKKQPLMPCHPARARKLLRKGQAAVFRLAPFTIILKKQTTEHLQPIQLSIDPGSRQTGLA